MKSFVKFNFWYQHFALIMQIILTFCGGTSFWIWFTIPFVILAWYYYKPAQEWFMWHFHYKLLSDYPEKYKKYAK